MLEPTSTWCLVESSYGSKESHKNNRLKKIVRLSVLVGEMAYGEVSRYYSWKANTKGLEEGRKRKILVFKCSNCLSIDVFFVRSRKSNDDDTSSFG